MLDELYSKMCVYTSTFPTEEQKEFIYNFDKDMLCFASPGTGKTSASAFGLIFAQLGYKIKGNNIQAISFTNNAAAELSVRYRRMCRQLRIPANINFSTLHSLCVRIIETFSNKLETGKITIEKTFSDNYAERLKMLEGAIKDLNLGQQISQKSYRSILRAINKLNSSLGFSRDTVTNSIDFVDCNISFETFMNIRHYIYNYYKALGSCNVNDILLYTLEILERFPEVSEALQEENKLVLVDEAQDLSLLQLRILHLISGKLILIGDIKQQIYAFNGACQEIVEQFFKLYPNAVKLNFTHSFRCKSEVANFANSIMHIDEPFKGVSEGGSVNIYDTINFEEIAKRVKNEDKSFMFLFRNNFSAIPLVETLYRLNVPFRAKYPNVAELPVISDLLALVNLAQFPGNADFAVALKFLIPEFKAYNPFVKILKEKKAKTIYDISYSFTDDYTGTRALEVLYEVQGLIEEFAPLATIFNTLYPLYEKSWLSKNSYRLEMEPDYYLNIIQTVISGKTLDQFRQDEKNKEKIIQESELTGIGARCYTMHAGKGLECDVVYIIDAEEVLLPSKKNIKHMLDKNCVREIARTVRNERSLCYVAVTRAKDEVNIYYNKELSSMFKASSPYDMYEDVLKNVNSLDEGDDESFKEFYMNDSFGQLYEVHSDTNFIDWGAV